MRNTFLKTLVLTANFLFISAFANASCLYEDFEGWKDCFVKDKLSQMMNSIDIDTFRAAQFIPRVVELDQKQPEKTLTYSGYKKAIDIEGKVKRGREFYQENYKLVQSIANEYSIEPEIIVALIGIESDYGRRMGNFNIISSLATLAYEGRRKQFFEKELLNSLLIARNENLSYDSFQGSWAGAMGQCQFMPSSFLSFAVDYDKDGVKDIWNSKADVLASAANYLSQNGWKLGHTSVKKIKKVNNKLTERCDKKSAICEDKSNLKLISVKNNDKDSAEFAVGGNYKVILSWNRSDYFALSVLTIADKIKMEG